MTIRDLPASFEFAKFNREDNGNCRVYYKRGGKLYCWQIDNYRDKTFELLHCTRDGEPSHRVVGDVMPWRVLTPAQTAVGRELNEWLKRATVTSQTAE